MSAEIMWRWAKTVNVGELRQTEGSTSGRLQGLTAAARAPPIDFIATMLTANLHLQRPFWSRQIAKPNVRIQSEAVITASFSLTY